MLVMLYLVIMHFFVLCSSIVGLIMYQSLTALMINCLTRTEGEIFFVFQSFLLCYGRTRR